MILAHGIGARSDLPLPGELVLQAGGFVVLASFLLVGLFWRRPRFAELSGGAGISGAESREPMSSASDLRVAQRVAERDSATAVGWIARAVTLLLAGYVTVVAFAGSADPDVNPAPRALYVLLWVGVVPASLVFGPVWRAVNPLRLVHRLLVVALRLPPDGFLRWPDRLGYWPAAVGLAAFVWLELVPRSRTEPEVVGAFLVGYALVVTGLAVVFGARAFARADSFEVYSSLIAALAPIRWRSGTGFAVRNPLRELADIPVAPGLIAVLAVWWGSTVFDGLSSATAWLSFRQASALPAALLDTCVLLLLFVVVAVSYRVATGDLATQLVSTLIPIAVGYTVAHYASLLIVEGPKGLAQLVGASPPDLVVNPVAIAVIQVAAVLLGHVLGVIAAHDRSAALLPAQRRLADQIPLVLIMIVYTMVGLYLLVIA